MKEKSEVNTVVSDIWCEILGLESVQQTDSFFDLAGTSIAAEQIASRIGDVLEVSISGIDIMRRPILSEVVDLVASRVAG